MNKCEGWSNEFELNMFHYNSMYTHTHTNTHKQNTQVCGYALETTTFRHIVGWIHRSWP